MTTEQAGSRAVRLVFKVLLRATGFYWTATTSAKSLFTDS